MRTDALAKQVDDLLKQNQNLSSRVSALEAERVFRQLMVEMETKATFDPHAEQKYSPVKGPVGPMLMVLEKVEPYLDGFTVHLRVGNPTSVNFTGMKGKVRWGRRYDAQKDDAYNQLAEKEIDLKDSFLSGYWTVVKFNVAPAKPEDVGRIIVEPEFNTLRMRN
jgi:hypothetical protein